MRDGVWFPAITAALFDRAVVLSASLLRTDVK